jgi:transcriptional regulator with XRE-family HTH domain
MKEKIQTAFGQILRRHRNLRGLFQEKLAELADLDRTYISQIERGLKSPSMKALIALDKALDIKAHILVCEVENELDASK